VSNGNGNGNRLQHPKKRAFIAAYRNSGTIRAAAEAAGIDRVTYWRWTEHDPVFAAAAAQAKEEYADLLEAKLSQLSLKQDNVTALIVGLKMTGRFVERTRAEVSGPEGQPIQVQDVGKLNDAELDNLIADLNTPAEGSARTGAA
jgi:hypothetical protein